MAAGPVIAGNFIYSAIYGSSRVSLPFPLGAVPFIGRLDVFFPARDTSARVYVRARARVLQVRV